MEQGYYWETDSRLAVQEITRSLWNPNSHYRAYKSPPLGYPEPV